MRCCWDLASLIYRVRMQRKCWDADETGTNPIESRACQISKRQLTLSQETFVLSLCSSLPCLYLLLLAVPMRHANSGSPRWIVSSCCSNHDFCVSWQQVAVNQWEAPPCLLMQRHCDIVIAAEIASWVSLSPGGQSSSTLYEPWSSKPLRNALLPTTMLYFWAPGVSWTCRVKFSHWIAWWSMAPTPCGGCEKRVIIRDMR
jgi:hypothetical protein